LASRIDQASSEDIQEALQNTHRWLRKITKTLKDGMPEDEEAKERFNVQLMRARRQVRRNRELFGFGETDESDEDDDDGSLVDNE
jgi:hypothetical protein